MRGQLRRVAPYILAVLLPAALTFVALVGIWQSEAFAQNPVCYATNVGLTQLSGTVANNIYTGTCNLIFGCLPNGAAVSECAGCYKTVTEYWSFGSWHTDSSDGPDSTGFKGCGSGNTIPLTVTVSNLSAGYTYRTTVSAAWYNINIDMGGNVIGCGSGNTYGVSTYDEYED